MGNCHALRARSKLMATLPQIQDPWLCGGLFLNEPKLENNIVYSSPHLA
jgi:hypothetical protein